jgi:hypothetical protein
LLTLRSPLILGAASAGIVLAALAWFALDAGSWVTRPLDRLAARLAAVHPTGRVEQHGAGDAIAGVLASPIFVSTTGPGAVPDPVVALSGVAISPRGASALIAVDGKPAAWMDQGATLDGVTLISVSATRVVVDTAIGFKDVALWGQAPASQTSVAKP